MKTDEKYGLVLWLALKLTIQIIFKVVSILTFGIVWFILIPTVMDIYGAGDIIFSIWDFGWFILFLVFTASVINVEEELANKKAYSEVKKTSHGLLVPSKKRLDADESEIQKPKN